jgi:hypothetical protein
MSQPTVASQADLDAEIEMYAAEEFALATHAARIQAEQDDA